VNQLSVSYERKFSDGNYGSEGISVSWTWDAEAEDERERPGGSMEAALIYLRRLVLRELSKSAAERVRWAANHELHAGDPKPAAEALAAPEDVPESLEDLPF
jgi:hypothetical protein